MAGDEQRQQNNFMIEKIKERPINKRRLIRRTLITALMAVVFGTIACVTFLLLEPIISNKLYPEEEPQIIIFPKDQEEMSPEDMLSNIMIQENDFMNGEEESIISNEILEQILNEMVYDKDDYRQMYTVLSQFVSELNQSMVTITGITSNIDWFNNVQESSNQTSGVIIANNKKELLILCEYSPINKADSLSVTFYNNIKVMAEIKSTDTMSGIAIVAVDLEALTSYFPEEEIRVASLGSSNHSNIVGTPVIALGNPMGNMGSLGYGMISSTSGQLTDVDYNYELLQTDIAGSQNAGGILFNYHGQIVGIITNSKSSSDMKNFISAYGISELRGRIQKITNGENFAYLGVIGMDVSYEAHENLGVPYGAFVKETAIDSPAMLAGVSQGDVIVKIDDNSLTNYSDYISALMQHDADDNITLTVLRQVQNEYREITFNITLTKK